MGYYHMQFLDESQKNLTLAKDWMDKADKAGVRYDTSLRAKVDELNATVAAQKLKTSQTGP
jgi:hypothetical protein